MAKFKSFLTCLYSLLFLILTAWVLIVTIDSVVYAFMNPTLTSTQNIIHAFVKHKAMFITLIFEAALRLGVTK